MCVPTQWGGGEISRVDVVDAHLLAIRDLGGGHMSATRRRTNGIFPNGEPGRESGEKLKFAI